MEEGCGREWEMMGESGEFLAEFTTSIIMHNNSATATIDEKNENVFLYTYKGTRGEEIKNNNTN